MFIIRYLNSYCFLFEVVERKTCPNKNGKVFTVSTYNKVDNNPALPASNKNRLILCVLWLFIPNAPAVKTPNGNP